MGPVRGPGAGEQVDIDLVPLHEVQQDALPHHVVAAVLPVLVDNTRHVLQ